jgi:hypothetical protein
MVERPAPPLREDWTARIEEAAGNPLALHDVAVAWSETARQDSASLLDEAAEELRARHQMLERLRQEKRAMAPLAEAANRRPNILFNRKRLQAANARFQSSYGKTYEMFEQARQNPSGREASGRPTWSDGKRRGGTSSFG